MSRDAEGELLRALAAEWLYVANVSVLARHVVNMRACDRSVLRATAGHGVAK